MHGYSDMMCLPLWILMRAYGKILICLEVLIMKSNVNEFYCDKCGICCRSLKGIDLYSHLNRGDGVCIFLNEDTKLCNIYEERPLVCRVDDIYEVYFSKYINKEEYHDMNYNVCLELKRSFEKDDKNE